MRAVGVLEAMAEADVEELVRRVSRRYPPGGLEAATAADPAWRASLERTERELGGLYESLREADRALGRWRRTVADLERLWARVGGEVEADQLEHVA